MTLKELSDYRNTSSCHPIRPHGDGKKGRQKLTLHRPATYQIKVPGELGGNWADWVEGMTVAVARDGDSPPVTTLTGTLDQAALQGLLRQLYSLGLPLISCVWMEAEEES